MLQKVYFAQVCCTSIMNEKGTQPKCLFYYYATLLSLFKFKIVKFFWFKNCCIKKTFASSHNDRPVKYTKERRVYDLVWFCNGQVAWNSTWFMRNRRYNEMHQDRSFNGGIFYIHFNFLLPSHLNCQTEAIRNLLCICVVGYSFST